MMWSMYLLSFQTFLGEIQILKQKHSMLGGVIGVKVNTFFLEKNNIHVQILPLDGMPA